MLIVAVCTHTPSLFLDSFTLWLLHLIYKYSRCLSPSGNVCRAPPGSVGLASPRCRGLTRGRFKDVEISFFSLQIQEYKFYFISSDVVSSRTLTSVYSNSRRCVCKDRQPKAYYLELSNGILFLIWCSASKVSSTGILFYSR